MRIIANMVGRNEADRYLEPVLQRLREQVDVICFMDDCSDDNTIDIVSKYADSITRMHQPTFVKNEYTLRACAWKIVDEVAEAGDWILSIDCDEMLYGAEHMRDIAEVGKWDVVGVKFFHMWNETQYRIDGKWCPSLSWRFFRYQEGGEFKKKRLACGAEPTYVMDAVRTDRARLDTPLMMKHLGYSKYEDQLAKYARYMELDGGQFHSAAHLKSIITTPTLAEWEYD